MTTTGQLDKPILQIVHISDLHFHSGGAPQNDQRIKSVIAYTRVLPPLRRWLLDYWEDGRAGHAADALVAFEDFLRSGTTLDVLKTNEIPTWLVDTGDLASMGDDASVNAELDWVNKMGKNLGVKQVVRLYGNHDAWPNTFPLSAKKASLNKHRDDLRNNHFPSSWPVAPISQPIDSVGNRIDLYALNSVIHDWWFNSWALGKIENDPHWSGSGSQDQLPELAKLVNQAALNQAGRAFRILLTHHPVHYPGIRCSWKMALRNDTQVAGQLVNLPSSGTGPLAHLVLSGHTHRLYPAHSKLPPNAGALRHPPLGLHQLQLVVGSLSKAVRDTTKPTPDQSYDVNGEPHQCQVLRFFPISGHSHNSLVVKRLLIGRNNGTGQFKFIEVSSNPTEYWEETYLNF